MERPREPQPAAAEPETREPPPGNPWYLRPYFGSGPAVAPGPLRVLRLVSLGYFFENYDLGLLNSALPQISADLGISTGDTGFYLSAIRLGGLATFLVLPFADRIGRRRVFLAALIGMSVGTALTAFSQNAIQFVVAQFSTRIFMLTVMALSVVILAEEFQARHRGAGIALLSVLGGIGYGVGAVLYAGIDWLPGGWRSLYAIGVLPLLLLPFFRRSLRETGRFERHRAAREREGPARTGAGGSQVGWLRPILLLVRVHPGRALIVGLAGSFTAMASIAFFQYTSYFLRHAHGWAPGDYTLLVLGGGLLGLCGNVVGGRGSDRIGRRPLGCLFLSLAPLAAFAFYFGPSFSLALCWGLFVFCMAVGDLIVRAFSAELFPTSYRGTSTGWFILVQSVGWVTALLLVGLGTDSLDDLAWMVSCVSLAAVLAGLCLLLLPETGARELEEISETDPDRAAS